PPIVSGQKQSTWRTTSRCLPHRSCTRQSSSGTLVGNQCGCGLDLSPFLTQSVKTQNPLNGELSHGDLSQAVHSGVQVGRRSAAGVRGFIGRGDAGVGSQTESRGPL